MSKTVEEDDILLHYIYLCANPLRDDNQLIKEYEQLKNHPRVTRLAFFRPDVLMVGTDKIIVTDKDDVRRLIGEFIIFLIRKQVEGYWEVDFRFWNVTHPLDSVDKKAVNSDDVKYIHPHIMPTKDGLLECPNGSLCISKGQFDVYQNVRKGEMHHAAPRLIKILETYPTGMPYHGAQYWPEWKDDSHA